MISKTDSLKLEVSEAFLLSLETVFGPEGVPPQLAPLWCLKHVVWKLDLHAKHLRGLAGFLRGLEQRAQERPV